MNWHSEDIKNVFEEVGSSEEGLSTAQAGEILAKQGPNQLREKKKKPAWLLFLSQFSDFMVVVLMAAAVISGIAGDLTDTIIILIIVLLNAILGFVQEYRAEKALAALKKMSAANATVKRNGRITSVPAVELVPGDVVLLEAGNVVPADIRLFETHSLRSDESSLTGESVSVEKISSVIEEKDLPPGDRYNMVFKTSLITAGRASGVVVATGMATEIGKIAGLLDREETVTPLQARMADFGKKLSYLILIICALLFGIGLLRGEDTMQMLLLAISLAVAAIPEALPALITIALAMGAKRMVKINALMRKLHAVETLGSVTYICSDKTGTLTMNKMTVVDFDRGEEMTEDFEGRNIFELGLALNNDVSGEAGNWMGDPTEIALVEHAAGIKDSEAVGAVREKFSRVAELPFDSDRKCMTTVHKLPQGFLCITKGAAESVAEAMDDGKKGAELTAMADKLAQDGKRVLAFGYRILSDIPEPFTQKTVETGLVYAGMVAMIDPPREEVKEAITECRAAGIHPVMITGDHPATAASIARTIGILRQGHEVITGRQLQAMEEEEFENRIENIRVYARVSPEQKLNIVKALQRKKHFVAMTGDGVNDAPSLRSANIGIAMGINGSDVSKEAAHMVLLDDNFATIVKAIREGRRIYDNIRKFVKYIMTCNGAEIWTIFLAPVFGLPMPLLPIHILWINLVTDGLPGLALAGEKAEKDVMQRAPRRTDESLFSRGVGFHIIWVGMLMAAVTLGSQAFAISFDNPKWQTIVFTVLTFSQMGHVMAIRSDSRFLYQQGLKSNPSLIGAVVLTFLIHLCVIYLPAANTFFKTMPLSITELAVCTGISALVFHAVEFEKWIRLRRKNAD